MGVGVIVTLNVTGITVAIGSKVEPFRMSVVNVEEAVVRESEAESEDDGDGEPGEAPEDVEDWAETDKTRMVRRRRVAAHDEDGRGSMANGGDGEWVVVGEGGERAERGGMGRVGLYEGEHLEENEGVD